MKKSSQLPIVSWQLSRHIFVKIVNNINHPYRWLFMMIYQNRKVAEDPTVEEIRVFFNKKTNYLRADKLSQVYIAAKLTKEDADKYQLNLDDLRLMFQAYCQDPTFTPSLDLPVGAWKFWSIKNWRELGTWFFVSKPSNIIRRRTGKFVLAGGIAAALLGGMAGTTKSILNLSGVERERYFQAWQVINTAKDQPGMGGRNEALKYLNKEASSWYTPECKHNNNCLVGIKIEKANLNKANLEGANLRASEFRGTSFREAILRSTHFENAHLEGAVFADAHLEGAVFTGADLTITKNLRNDPELKGAIFKGATLTNTNFKGAKNLDVTVAFGGATYCHTTMPDGSVEKPECK
jgi:Pentapeptide repeats (9 copies)